MIGAAHTSTVREIQAARADLFAAEAHSRPDPTDTPFLYIESVFADSRQTLEDWARDAREAA